MYGETDMSYIAPNVLMQAAAQQIFFTRVSISVLRTTHNWIMMQKTTCESCMK